MSTKPKILVQLDSDPNPSVFDAVVAIDSGVEHLLQYGDVEPTNVVPLIHGCIFTRGPADLKHTAIFVGGSDASEGEAIADEIRQTFFGPMRVSVLIDGNGSNTTAAAAVLSAHRHLELANAKAVVLGGTGPVGTRVARLLARAGAEVRVASRDANKAQVAVDRLREKLGESAKLSIASTASAAEVSKAISGCNLVIACGAAGSRLVSQEQLDQQSQIRVAIDLNAVPPTGIEGIDVMDSGKERNGRIVYGAIGVGGLKMKIHKQALRLLFTRNDLILDAEEIYDVGLGLLANP